MRVMEEEVKKKSSLREFVNSVIYIAVVVGFTFLFIHFVAQVTRVSGRSMEPTLHGTEQTENTFGAEHVDSLIVDKISYRFRDPERFDIIVFPFQHAEHTYFIKRIIGLPGETVLIDEEGNIYINGERLYESYGKEVILFPGIAQYGITLGDDEYFVMGDNRNNSMDSRDENVGNIHKDQIIGRAFLRFYPFSEFGLLHGE